jgi:hypothetical protein
VKVKKYKSDKIISIDIKKYKIDWNSAPSKGQQILQDFLFPYWKTRLILREMRVPGTLWRFDLVDVNSRTIVEYSPISHHGNYNPFFHKTRAGYLKSIKSDIYKLEWAEQNGFKVIEIQECDLPFLSLDYIYNKFGVNLI